MTMLCTHFALMARYNAWANETLYAALAALPAEDIHKTRPAAYFGSIFGTLNHLLLVDRLWFGRLKGTAPAFRGLDQILYEDLPALHAARKVEDARIVALVEAYDDAALSAPVHYTDSKGNPGALPAWQLLATVFNHQTHHRGQVHALIKEAGYPPPSLDLPVYLRTTKE